MGRQEVETLGVRALRYKHALQQPELWSHHPDRGGDALGQVGQGSESTRKGPRSRLLGVKLSPKGSPAVPLRESKKQTGEEDWMHSMVGQATAWGCSEDRGVAVDSRCQLGMQASWTWPIGAGLAVGDAPPAHTHPGVVKTHRRVPTVWGCSRAAQEHAPGVQLRSGTAARRMSQALTPSALSVTGSVSVCLRERCTGMWHLVGQVDPLLWD